MNQRECYACGTQSSPRKGKGRKTEWLHNKDHRGRTLNLLCLQCTGHFIRNPIDIKRKVENGSNKRKIAFMGRYAWLGWNPRNYVCSDCKKSSKRTDMHHLKYIPCMPWACTMELCIRCHRLRDGNDFHGKRNDGSKNQERNSNGQFTNIKKEITITV